MSQMLRSSGEQRNTAPRRKRAESKSSTAGAAVAAAGREKVPLAQVPARPEEGAAAEQSVFEVADFPAEAASPAAALSSLKSATQKEQVAVAMPYEAVKQVYQILVEAAAQVFDAAAKEMVPDSAAIIGAVRQARKQLEEGDELLAAVVRQRRDFRSWPERAANVAILSMRLGMGLEADERRCLALGLCGLMHDIGMLTVPPEVLDSPKFTPAQLELLHQHPIKSQQMVQNFGESFAWIGKIVAQVHERRNGKGYPHGLKGEKIHEVARILGAADTYEAMAHPRPDRKAQAMYNAVKEIIDQRNAQFDRRIIRALIHIVSIFPLGSLVKLNNGEIGRVIAVSRTHPTRPTVEIMIDSRGQHLPDPRAFDLENEPMIYIVDPAIDSSFRLGICLCVEAYQEDAQAEQSF
jgi:HD-GYP domain-containing protein (c-di-GMP phosphodiesterase class II)